MSPSTGTVPFDVSVTEASTGGPKTWAWGSCPRDLGSATLHLIN